MGASVKKVLKAFLGLFGNSQSFSFSSHECRVNGKTLKISGNTVSICNGRVFVDGVEQSDAVIPGITKVIVHGSVSTLRVDQCSLTVEGGVGSIESKQCSIKVQGNVSGNIRGSQCSVRVHGSNA
jgi:hypothetical protein